MNPQSFKDERMERMIGRSSMPNSAPVRDPRTHGMKDPAAVGEQMTQMESRLSGQKGVATNGPRPGGYRQQAGPGMLPQ